jgi:hypothetical protein
MIPMRFHNFTSRFVAGSLVLLLSVCTIPLSAAELNSKATSLGALTAVGSVQLRGVSVNEGTVFSGDRLSVAPGSYARVATANGQKLEVGSGSDVQVTSEGKNLRVQMVSGNVGFQGKGQKVTFQLGAYEMTVDGDAAGQVAFVGQGAFGVRMVSGTMNVRNAQTKQSFVVKPGTERMVSLSTGADMPTMAQLASSVPAAVPAMPAPRRRDLSNGMVAGLVAGAASGAALITYFLAREDGDARAEQLKLLTNLAAVQQNAASVSSAAAQISSTASAAQTAINNATNLTATQKAALSAQVATINSRASGASAKVTTLSNKVASLQNTIANQEDGATQAQQNELASLLTELKAARDEVNDGVNLLNALLSQAGQQGVGNLPSNNQGQVSGPTISSASSPL